MEGRGAQGWRAGLVQVGAGRLGREAGVEVSECNQRWICEKDAGVGSEQRGRGEKQRGKVAGLGGEAEREGWEADRGVGGRVRGGGSGWEWRGRVLGMGKGGVDCG